MSSMEFICIENNPVSAQIYEQAGVSRIMVDLESMGKHERQGHLDTFISSHHITDIEKVKSKLTKAKLMVRTDPWHSELSSQIETSIAYGADILMLPMFRTAYEVKSFISEVAGRSKICLLLETKEALENVEEILDIKGIDEVYIGLNDLSLSLGLRFLFEPIVNGLIDNLIPLIVDKKYRFGFGGIGTVDSGRIKGGDLIWMHALLNSNLLILSRSFKNACGKSPEKIAYEISRLNILYDEALHAEHSLKREKELHVKNLIGEIIKEMC